MLETHIPMKNDNRIRGTKTKRSRRASFEVLNSRVMLTTIAVTNLLDGPVTSAGDLPGSLRQAIFDSNALAGADVVDISVAGTISLTAGELTITDDVTITGPGAEVLEIDGNGLSRILNVDDSDASANIRVAVRNVALVNGSSSSDGGAIRSVEELTIVNSIVSGSTAANAGGGIFSDPTAGGRLNVVRSVVSGNTAGTRGGGIRTINPAWSASSISESSITNNVAMHGGGISAENDDGGSLSVVDSVVADNSATVDGGGIDSDNIGGGELLLQRSTVSGNEASVGAGLNVTSQRQGSYYYYYQPYEYTYIPYDPETMTGGYGYGTGPYGPYYGYIPGSSGKTTISNSTISGNTAETNGGGIHSVSASFGSSAYTYGSYDTTLMLENSTVSGNTAERGGAVSRPTRTLG